MEEWPKIALSLALAGGLLASDSLSAPVQAEVKTQATLGFAHSAATLPGDFQLVQSSLRLKTADFKGPWSWDAHALIAADYSPDWQIISAELSRFPARPLFDWDTTITNGSEGVLTARVDRATLIYSTGVFVAKVGRQALTWGNGKVFNPMDRFAPFSPQAQDTSYKPGSDMVYLQKLFDSGADLQVIHLPRRNVSTNRIDRKVSSTALKYLFQAGDWQIELMTAEDWDDELGGVSTVVPIGSSLWSTDFVYTRLVEGGDSLSYTTNIQQAWTWNGKPMTGFAEFSHSGIGVSESVSAMSIPDRLLDRISRGQLFNTGRNYLAIGASIQSSPLVMIAPSLILNLHDNSGIALMSAQWNASNQDNLILGLQAPFGSKDSEYGSIENSTQLYLRWEKYF